jgi:hypothetical protein
MKQQTAVEYLIQKVELISNNKTLSKKEAIKLYNWSIEQANKMFEQQIIDAWNENFDSNEKIYGYTAEQYYSKTFNK